MKIETNVSAFVTRLGMVVPFDTLKKAAEECDAYDWMRIGEGCYACRHGETVHVVIEKDGMIGCSCGAMTFHCRENDVCKHIAAFDRRSEPPQKKISKEIAQELIKAGWIGDKGNLTPPETTLNAEVEDVHEAEKTDKDAHHVEPPLGTKMWTRTCPHCDQRFEGGDLDDVKRRHREHVPVCPKNPANKAKEQEQKATDAKNATVEPEQEATEEMEETNMEEEQTTEQEIEVIEDEPTDEPERHVCEICGKEHPNADGVLNCVMRHNEQQDAVVDETIDLNTCNIASMIRNLGAPRLTEAGGIRIGRKKGRGTETFDHFIFTLPEKDPTTGDFYRDAKMEELYGDNCRELPVRLLSDDITECFTTFYAKYGAGGIKIRGDGVNWAVTNPDGSKTYIEDPNGEHGFLNDPDVKPQGILTVLVDGQGSVGTVYRFRTSGWNSIKGMLASISLCAEIANRAGGRIAFLPMLLVYRTKEVTPKGERYKKTIPVITIEFRGTIEELQEKSRDATKYLSSAPGDALQLAGVNVYDPNAETIEEMEDVRAEFYPGVD